MRIALRVTGSRDVTTKIGVFKCQWIWYQDATLCECNALNFTAQILNYLFIIVYVKGSEPVLLFMLRAAKAAEGAARGGQTTSGKQNAIFVKVTNFQLSDFCAT